MQEGIRRAVIGAVLLVTTAAAVSLTAGMARAEAPAPPPPTAYINTRMGIIAGTSLGDVVATAKCEPGEQLLGGGYFSGDSFSSNAITKASYPSGSESWTAIFYAGANPSAVLVAYAYCLDAPGFPVDAVTQVADNSQQDGSEPILASCPQGSVLTGGGFAVDGETRDNDRHSNSDVIESTPALAEDGVAIGWRVRQHLINPSFKRGTRAYAVCARKGLHASPAAVLAKNLTQSGAAVGEHELVVECPANGISTGGGHTYVGDWLISHPVLFSRSPNDLRGWQARVFGGWQTTNYSFRPCDPGVSDCLSGIVVAACYLPPDIPFIWVKITSPSSGSHFDTETSSPVRGVPGPKKKPGVKTAPITFTAEVLDKNGAAIPNARVSWSFSVPVAPAERTTLGAGRELTVRLPAGQAISHLKVTATAWAGKLHASDQIDVSTGTVP